MNLCIIHAQKNTICEWPCFDFSTQTNSIPEYIYTYIYIEGYAAGETSTNRTSVLHSIAWENITERYRTLQNDNNAVKL
jgi:hypothetical protein